MQASNPEPDTPRCACGRESKLAVATVYRSPQGRFVFHRCDCGVEWTERLEAVDPTEPISGDEVLEVHEVLALFEGSLADLIGIRPAS
jgi:hypothetical protein